MITTLLNNLSTIYSEVMTKLIPENIKSGVNILNVTGTLSSGGNEKPYTELEYIESTGTQYIDTGFKPNQDTRVKMEVSNAGANSYWFGVWNVAYNNGAYALGNDVNNVYIGYDGQGIATGSVYLGAVNVDFNKNDVYINNSLLSSLTYTSFQVNYPLFLFGQNRAASTVSLSSFRMHSCQIYDNGTLVRDFIPVKDFNNVVCLYDKVSGRFFYNEGTGDFVAGPEINGYTELLYIQSSGTQYINTQETLTTDSKIEVTYLLDALTTGQGILGAGDWMTYADGLGGSSGTFGIFVNGTSTAAFTYNLSTNELMNVIITDDTITINNSQQTNLSLLSGMSASLGLLDNTYDERASAKIFNCKVYQNNVLTKDLVPVKRKSDNVICMYDKVNNVFYTNAGTGSFVAGPER